MIVTEAVDNEGDEVGNDVSCAGKVGNVDVDCTGVDVGKTVVCAVVEACTVVRLGVVNDVCGLDGTLDVVSVVKLTVSRVVAVGAVLLLAVVVVVIVVGGAVVGCSGDV